MEAQTPFVKLHWRYDLLSDEDVRAILDLAELTSTGEELDLHRDRLNKVLQYINQLNAIDVTGVEPCYQPHGISNVMREDVLVSPLERKEILDMAPKSHLGRYFCVPLTVDSSSGNS